MRILLIALMVCTFLCAHAQYGKARLQIHPLFNGKALKKDVPYTTEHGDTVYFDLLRFYLSDISFAGTATNAHLFDWDEAATATITIDKVPLGKYNAVRFIVGVDSIANTSGANEGDLDPMHGMYWAWNSGYIMAKLEGHSSKCKTLHHAFEFHIGGYMPPYNAARPIVLSLPRELEVKADAVAEIWVNADIAAWFAGGVDVSKTNSILIPGKDACNMADRYAKMFSVSYAAHIK